MADCSKMEAIEKGRTPFHGKRLTYRTLKAGSWHTKEKVQILTSYRTKASPRRPALTLIA